MLRDYLFYLEDILRSCKKIIDYTNGLSLSQFKADDKTYDAVIRNLEIIGEAAKKIPDDVRKSAHNIEWRKIAGLRDMLIHAYFGIDDHILWDVIQHKIPELNKAVTLICSLQKPTV